MSNRLQTALGLMAEELTRSIIKLIAEMSIDELTKLSGLSGSSSRRQRSKKDGAASRGEERKRSAKSGTKSTRKKESGDKKAPSDAPKKPSSAVYTAERRAEISAKILGVLEKEPDKLLSLGEIVEKIGERDMSTDARRRIMLALQEQGKVRRVGNTKSAKYQIA